MELEKIVGKDIRAAVYLDGSGYVYSALPKEEVDLDIVDAMTMLAKNECSTRSCARCVERAECKVAVFQVKDKFLGVLYEKGADLSGIEKRVLSFSRD